MEKRNLLPDTGAGDIGYNPDEAGGLGYAGGVGSGDGYGNYASPNAMKQPTLHDIYAMAWLMASHDTRNANPNLQANPLYGYGNAPLEFDYRNYESPLDIPEGQDAVAGYFEDRGLADKLYSVTNSAQLQDDFAKAFTLLRNAQEYENNDAQWVLGDSVQDIQKANGGYRGLYGDMVANLLEGTPKGRQIIDSIPNHPTRERNITGPGQGGFIQK